MENRRVGIRLPPERSPPLSRTIRLSARPLTLSRPFFKQPKSEVTKCPLNSSPSKYPEFPLVQMTASHVQHPISHKQFQQILSRSCTLSEWIITLVLDDYYLDFINYKMINIPTSLLLKNGPSSVSPHTAQSVVQSNRPLKKCLQTRFPSWELLLTLRERESFGIERRVTHKRSALLPARTSDRLVERSL